jgi:hypothetical protein
MPDPRTGQMSGGVGRTNARPSMHMQSSSASNPYHPAPNPPPLNHASSSSYSQQGSPQAGHSSLNPSHSPDDCPGCISDFHAALRASEASALEDTRLREQRQREEDEHLRALQASEEEAKRQREAEEEELRQVMEASRIEEESAAKRRIEKSREEEEHRRILLEESRQSAMREDEERIRRAHAELFERSRREAEELARRRRLEEEKMQAMEASALEESRREMEEEWKRRDEEERALEEFLQRGGKQGEAAYWQQVSDDHTYNLAVEMNRTLSSGNEGASSSRSSRRPLPPTPGLAAQAAGVESTSPQTDVSDEWDHPEDESVEDSDGEDPFGDQAEALPSYDEVRSDRPPEAPQVIPEHVQFAAPPQETSPGHNNTLAMPLRLTDKSSASVDTTPRASLRDLPVPPTSNAKHTASGSQPPLAPIDEGALLPTSPSQAAEETEMPSTVVPPSIVISRASTRSTIASTRNQPPSSNQSEEPSSPSADSTFSRTSLQQRAMKGTDFGYSFEPFSPNLYLEDGEEQKKHFPSAIQIRATKADGSLRERQAYFTIRAHSWKMLLRALAWYGNTRVEAGAEEVVDASTPLKLRVEVEFVTPTKVEAVPTAGPKSVQEAYKNAHVAVCMSLIGSKSLKTSDAALATHLKQSSRSIDATYLRRGSTRRVIMLPSQAPILPLTVVRLAQHMHQAEVFSAACSSSSQTALHSPRDLAHAIERHDYSYLAKLKKKRKEANAADANGAAPGPSNGQSNGANEDDMLDFEVVDAFAEDEAGSSGRMSRVKAKVKRKLAGRSGESSNQDLESWITPFDLNEHG